MVGEVLNRSLPCQFRSSLVIARRSVIVETVIDVSIGISDIVVTCLFEPFFESRPASREREIIRLRYGIGDGYTYTLEEVGRIFKVTRERVRQVEAKALRKLQHPVRARKLEEFLANVTPETTAV